MARKLNNKGKIAFGLLAGVAIVAATVVLCITYIPVKPTAIYNSVRKETTITLTGSGENRNRMTYYKNKVNNLFIANGKENYNTEISTYDTVLGGLYNIFTFYQSVLPVASEGKISKKLIKKAEKSLSLARGSLQKVTEFINKNTRNLYYFTVAESVWKTSKIYYEEAIRNYAEGLYTLSEIYTQTITNGVYSNHMGKLVVEASSYYLSAIGDKLFGESAELSTATSLVSYFKTFSDRYLHIGTGNDEYKIVQYYYTSDTLIALEESLREIPENISIQVLLSKGLTTTGLTLDSTETVLASKAIAFLKGEVTK